MCAIGQSVDPTAISNQPGSGRSLTDQAIALAVRRNRDDLAGMLRSARVSVSESTITAIVVGETQCGKSSFVNALVGALVTPSDRPTSVYVVVGHDAEPGARVYTRDGDMTKVGLEELATFPIATDATRIQHIEVGLDAPLLAKGLRIVDTPAVGGLNAGNGQVTLAALAWADVLIFVVDGDAPLSQPELQFLYNATARIGLVLFVLTKIDVYPDWEVILAEDRALLEGSRYAAAPFLPVSSFEKLEGQASGDNDAIACSGFAEVERTLMTNVIERARQLRVWNLAKTVEYAIDEIDRSDQMLIDAPAAPEAAGVEAAQAQYQKHREVAATWSGTLFIEFQRRVSNPVNHALRRGLSDLVAGHERAFTEGHVALNTLSEQVRGDIEVVAAQVLSLLASSAEQLLRDMTKMYGLQAADPWLAQLDLPFTVPPIEAPIRPKPVGKMSHGVSGFSSMTRSALYGRSLAAALGPAGLALGILLGGAALGSSEWVRHKASDQQAGQSLVRRAVDIAQIELDAEIKRRLLDVQQAIQQELRTGIDQREASLRKSFDELQENAKRNVADQEQARLAARGRLQQSAPLRELAVKTAIKVEEAIGHGG